MTPRGRTRDTWAEARAGQWCEWPRTDAGVAARVVSTIGRARVAPEARMGRGDRVGTRERGGVGTLAGLAIQHQYRHCHPARC